MHNTQLHVSTSEGIAAAVAAAAQHAPHQVPLYRAAHVGLIGIVQPTREGIISTAHFRRMSGQPWLVLLGDDDGIETGPDGWACAKRALGWARQVVIHGAAGHAEHYAGVAAATVVIRRFVLIECASAKVETWHAAAIRWAPRAVIQRVVPAIGHHPLPLDKSKMQ